MAPQKITILHVDDESIIQQTLAMKIKRGLVACHPDIVFEVIPFINHEEMNEWLAAHPQEQSHCFIVSDNKTVRGGEGLEWFAQRDAQQRAIPAILFSSDNHIEEQVAELGVKHIHKLIGTPYPSVMGEIERAFGLSERVEAQAAAAAAARGAGGSGGRAR